VFSYLSATNLYSSWTTAVRFVQSVYYFTKNSLDIIYWGSQFNQAVRNKYFNNQLSSNSWHTLGFKVDEFTSGDWKEMEKWEWETKRTKKGTDDRQYTTHITYNSPPAEPIFPVMLVVQLVYSSLVPIPFICQPQIHDAA